MSSQAFDEKNEQDFERITQALNDALSAISKDDQIKASITELSRIAGVHRNTIYQRKWPIERIAEIKDQRQLKKMALARKKAKRQDPVGILETKLEKSRLEVVYWFNRFRDAKETSDALNNRLDRMRSSRDVALQDAESLRAKVKSLESEIDKLQDVISVLETEQKENLR